MSCAVISFFIIKNENNCRLQFLAADYTIRYKFEAAVLMISGLFMRTLWMVVVKGNFRVDL